jgi:hypothetical protein
MLEKDEFAISPGEYARPTNLIDKGTWESIVGLPDDVSIRTSDKYGSQLDIMWDFWGTWIRVVLGLQALTKHRRNSPTAIAACDATDEFQAATYVALVGYYRVAFSCLRNVLEQVTIASQLQISGNAQDFLDWRNNEDRVRFGWAADLLPRNPSVSALEQRLKASVADCLFQQTPKGLVRRAFALMSKYTHGAPGFADGDARESNGPIFLDRVFLEWRVAALKTYAIALTELKLAHPNLDELPDGPPSTTLGEFRRQVVARIPSDDPDSRIFDALVDS